MSELAHDLRTPLTAVLGYAELLQANHPREDQRPGLAAVVSAANELVAFVEKLLKHDRVRPAELTEGSPMTAMYPAAAEANMKTFDDVTAAGALPWDTPNPKLKVLRDHEASGGNDPASRTHVDVDRVTGKVRRAVGEVLIQKALDRSRRVGEPLLMAMVTLAGAADDARIGRVAGKLSGAVRSYDSVIRYGDDEFVCILDNSEMADHGDRFSSLAKQISDNNCTVRIGLAQLGSGDSLPTLVERARSVVLDSQAQPVGNGDTVRTVATGGGDTPGGAIDLEGAPREDWRRSLEDSLHLDDGTLTHWSIPSISALARRLSAAQAATAMVKTQREQLAGLKKAADTDFLTDVANRRAIEQRLEMEWRRARRHSRPLAVLLVDVDGLKEINDSHGHRQGDVVLAEVARRLVNTVRSEDQVARVGGDEFMIVCPETDGTSARAIAHKLTGAVEESVVADGDRATPVRVSVGWASTSARNKSLRGLVASADARLYRIKRDHHGVAPDD